VAVACLAVLALLTLANVVVRYLTSSLAPTEEVSIALMVAMTLAGASAAAARDRHVRIEYFYETGSARRRRRLGLLSAVATCVFFVLLGLLSGVVNGSAESAPNAYSASMFYIITYVLTTLGTFGLIQLLARQGFEAEEIDDLRGLNRRSPWMAFVALILMFSLAGIPPTVGFYAKLAVLQSVVNAGQIWLAILAVLASLVGAFYYLRVIKVMYFEEPSDTSPLLAGAGARFTLALNGGLVLLLGVLPSALMNACLTAVRQALAG